MKCAIFLLVPALLVKAAPVPNNIATGEGDLSSRQLTSLLSGILPYSGGQSRELSDDIEVPQMSRKQVDFNSLIASLGLEESGLLGSRQEHGAGGLLSGIVPNLGGLVGGATGALGSATGALGGASGALGSTGSGTSGQPQQQQQQSPPTKKPSSGSSCPVSPKRSVQERDGFPDLGDLGSDLGDDLSDTVGDAIDDLTSDRRQLLDPVETLVKSIPPPFGLTPPGDA